MVDIEKKIQTIRMLFIKKLDLAFVLKEEEFKDYCYDLTRFLIFNKYNSLLNLSEDDIKLYFDNYNNFCSNLGIGKRQRIDILRDNYGIIGSMNEDFINLYILLSMAENEDNTIRKDMFINSPKSFTRDINEVYARYKIAKDTNTKVTIKNLLNVSHKSFVTPYINTKYYHNPKKILKHVISKEEFIAKYPIDYSEIEKLKKEEINSNVSFIKQELTKKEKVLLAIRNFDKVNNLGELSDLLGISTSSLQRYLKEDSKEFVSKEKYLEIKKWLEDAKVNGLINGGKTSQELHGFDKDEFGHFKGSGKK